MEQVWVLGHMEDGEWKGDLSQAFEDQEAAQDAVDGLAQEEGAAPVARKFVAVTDSDLTPA